MYVWSNMGCLQEITFYLAARYFFARVGERIFFILLQGNLNVHDKCFADKLKQCCQHTCYPFNPYYHFVWHSQSVGCRTSIDDYKTKF